MLDLLNRINAQKHKETGKPMPIGEISSVVSFDKVTTNTIHTKSRTAFRRIRILHQEGKRLADPIFLDDDPVSKQELLDYAEALAQTEYRDGYVLGGYLCYQAGVACKLSDLAWMPTAVTVILIPRHKPGKQCKLLGVGKSGKYFAYNDLNAKYHLFKDESEAHFAYVSERRDYLKTLLVTLAPRPRAFLQAKIDRLTEALENKVPVEYL